MATNDRQGPRCEVLVVGAGPTGLMAAALLKRLGVDVRIVDDRPEASRESRALAIQARTMELLQHIGVVGEFLDRGVINAGFEFYVGGSRVGGFDGDRAASPDTPYPFILICPQSRTEAILIGHLAGLGVEVERGIKLGGLDQDADGVVARGSAAGGPVEIRAGYAIGADGAHSVVRKAIGLTFEGAKYPQTFLLADCRVGWAHDHSRARIFLNGASVGLFLPIDGAGCSRVMATDHTNKVDSGGPDASHLDLPELQAAFSEAAGIEVKLDRADWATRYRIHHRMVDRYREGRIFVAGDAAHIHSPAGGQGMNTGLQDAANLAWKLAAVLRGADPALLDTYDAERRPVAAGVLATSDRMFTAVAGQTGWEAVVRDWVARPMMAAASHLGAVQHQAFRVLSELDIAYDPGWIGRDEAHGLGGPAVGHRAPNAAIARHSDVFDLTAGYGFTALALSRKPLERDEAARAVGAAEALRGEGVAAHLVGRLAVGRDPRAVFVTSPEVFAAYGLTGPDAQAIYLVRPDGYVAWRGRGLDFDACRRALDRLGPAAGHPARAASARPGRDLSESGRAGL